MVQSCRCLYVNSDFYFLNFTVKDSTKPPSDPRESHHLCREFAITFPEIANILNTFVQVSELKTFLESYSHPLHPEQLYIDPKIYRDASTTEQVIKSLFPQYINYMHYYLLEDIVVRFHCDRGKEILQQYTKQKDSKKRKLEYLPGPITNGEIEQFHGTKRLKVELEGNTSDATLEVIGEIQKALEKATGVKRAVIVYAYDDPGSILLTSYIESCYHTDASTTMDVLESLFPQYINYMHYYLLEDIVIRFECDKAREVLQRYTELKYRHKRKLEDLPGPITNGEIEQFHGTIKLKVEVERDTSDSTVEVIGEVQDALEMATGVDRAVIVYACNDPGSVLTFLIPESILHIFYELNTEDLTILANSGVMKLEVDEFVIDNIQQYTTVKVAADSSEHTKQTGLKYYLQQRATDMTPERYSHLMKMLGSVERKMLNDDCSEEFLKTFAKDLQDLKKLDSYFSIHEWNIDELICDYPDEDDQKYQVLLCWKRAEGSTATYYNLLESLILHGEVEEVEALLQRLGEGNWSN